MLPVALLAAALSAPPDLQAVGIVMSARKEARTAVLASAGRTRVAGIGEVAFGGRVTAIEPGVVTLSFAGESVSLRLTSQAAAAAPPAPAPVAADAAPPVMERRDVERRLGEESSRILAETTLVPSMDQGRIAGFAITRMPQGTLLSDAGLMPGDVLTEVNGVAIDSLATLISLWPRLQAESQVNALVMRGGQPVTLLVSLR
jgi:general secretion pathway protein C